MEKPITTIEALAAMINTHMARKEDINAVNTRLDGIDSRLGRIEKVLMEEQKREMENLKARVKRLEDAVAL
jgi:archaellum component FlaC